ncbi:MAG: hypothetical protein GY839_19940 [candidate division Zixibacteria bacterium]|nr:hypothetical protein [candidate division Zixibacteria bacterium]
MSDFIILIPDMDNQKYTGKSFFRRLIAFSNEKPVKILIRIGFGFLNAIILYLVLYLIVTVMVYTVGFNTNYASVIIPYISWDCDEPVEGIIVPEGYTLFLCPKDDGEYINYKINDWHGDFVYIDIPKHPCDGELMADFWDEYVLEPKVISTHGPGHLKSIYSFNDTDVYVSRMGNAHLPKFFGYVYFASIPDSCIHIASFTSAPDMQKFLNVVDQIAFSGETSKTEFIGNVRGY